MHTSRALRSEDFEVMVEGRPARLDALLDGFDEHSRLGIVIADDGGGAGAGTLILAAVTAFYDRLRATGADFFAYPDYFAFHVGRDRGTLHMLDVFPLHKEPVVDDEAEAILRAINDRGVTHLLVPDRGPAQPELDRVSRDSASRRIRTAIAYAPNGRVAGADVAITAAATAEEFVSAMLQTAPAHTREVVGDDGRPCETFRRLTVDEALGMLETTAQ